MPSRPLSVTYTSLPHLSTIINLQPDREPWCAGYAPSQGRRCHVSTNANGRSCAMNILDKATEDLRAGKSINELLRELAPYVLCRRFHQNQTPGLARRWQKQVSSFVESRQSPPTQRTAQNPTGIRRQASRGQTTEERMGVLVREMEERMDEFLRLRDSAGFSTVSPGSQACSDIRQMVRAVETINNSTPHTINNIMQPRGDSITPVETLIQNSSDSTRIQSPRASVSSRSILVTSGRPSSRQAGATTTMPQNFNTEGSSHSVRPATHRARVTRRPAEGECGICLCPLQEPQSYGTEDKEEEDGEDGYEEEEESEEEEEQDDNDDTEDEQGYLSDDEREVEDKEDGLVWCKARCGVNYHRECIDKWLASGHYDSCPTCRVTWRY